MSLRLEQVQRLCGLEQSVCKKVLDSLVAVNFLYMKSDGTYARPTGETSGRLRSANAHLTVASPAIRRAG